MNDFIKNAIEGALNIQESLHEAALGLQARQYKEKMGKIPSGKSALKGVCTRNNLSLKRLSKLKDGSWTISIESKEFGGSKLKIIVPNQSDYLKGIDYFQKRISIEGSVPQQIGMINGNIYCINPSMIDNMVSAYENFFKNINNVLNFIGTIQPDAYEGNASTPLRIDNKNDEFDFSGPTEKEINGTPITYSKEGKTVFIIHVPVRPDTEDLIDNYEKSVIQKISDNFRVSQSIDKNDNRVRINHIRVSYSPSMLDDNTEDEREIMNKAFEASEKYFGTY